MGLVRDPPYRGREIRPQLVLPDVCGVPEVLLELDSRNCCRRNCPAGPAAAGTVLPVLLRPELLLAYLAGRAPAVGV